MVGLLLHAERVLVDSRLDVRMISGMLYPHQCIPVQWLARDAPSATMRASSALIAESDSELIHTADLLAKARSDAPGLAIFLVTDRRGMSDAERRHFAVAGVDYVFSINRHGDRQRLTKLITRHARVAAPHRVFRAMLQKRSAPLADALAQWSIRNSYWRPRISSAARAFGISSRTVSRILIRHSMPHFTELRGLGMLLHARELEARFGLSQSDAARRMQFRDGSRLSHLRLRWSMKESNYDYWRALLHLYATPVRKEQGMSERTIVTGPLPLGDFSEGAPTHLPEVV